MADECMIRTRVSEYQMIELMHLLQAEALWYLALREVILNQEGRASVNRACHKFLTKYLGECLSMSHMYADPGMGLRRELDHHDFRLILQNFIYAEVLGERKEDNG